MILSLNVNASFSFLSYINSKSARPYKINHILPDLKVKVNFEV